jgi:hypothetical protein
VVRLVTEERLQQTGQERARGIDTPKEQKMMRREMAKLRSRRGRKFTIGLAWRLSQKNRLSFTMGTGSTLALLPAQKRIDVMDYDPDKWPLFPDLSVTPTVDLKKTPSGPNAGRFFAGAGSVAEPGVSNDSRCAACAESSVTPGNIKPWIVGKF